MKKSLFAPLVVVGILCLIGSVHTASADNYPGNGTNGFGGAVGSGTLSVTNTGTGGLTFAFTVGGTATSFNGTQNDLVIYIDNNRGGGIGSSTSVLTDAGDTSRRPVSQYDGTNRSILGFGALMSPQYAIDLSSGQANIFQINNTVGNFAYSGGSNTAGTNSQNGVTYAASGSTFTVSFPATVIGLTAFSGATIKFVAFNVSQSGFSADEGTVARTGSNGYASTQTISAVNSFTTAVPEPGTWAMLSLGGMGALAIGCRRSARR